MNKYAFCLLFHLRYAFCLVTPIPIATPAMERTMNNALVIPASLIKVDADTFINGQRKLDRVVDYTFSRRNMVSTGVTLVDALPPLRSELTQ